MGSGLWRARMAIALAVASAASLAFGQTLNVEAPAKPPAYWCGRILPGSRELGRSDAEEQKPSDETVGAEFDKAVSGVVEANARRLPEQV